MGKYGLSSAILILASKPKDLPTSDIDRGNETTSRVRRTFPRSITKRTRTFQTIQPDETCDETAYKAVEVLLAGAVILGSTAGAWLGFTLISISPRRFAAGSFVYSYGQTLNGGMGSPGNPLPYPWPPAGTIWAKYADNVAFHVSPQVKMTDGVGYWVQFWLLMLCRHFKVRVSSALKFGPYVFTREAPRYIVLALEPFFFFMSGYILHQKLRESRSEYSMRNVLAVGVYFIMLSASLAVVVLGQKDFLDS